MIIQHNLSAMTATGHMAIHNGNISKSSRKLASGYRINFAADNAAKLAISEKMRNQIRGLNQSVRNAQDGANYIQTADGAMGEVHDILHRMQEITIQSLNDTNTESDRAALAAEFEQLQSEIDTVNSNTLFGHQPVFGDHDPSYYQIAGYRQWEPNQMHSILSPDNDLKIHLPATYNPCDYTVTVPEGIYTTQELVDELDDAFANMSPSNPGFVFEYTTDGHCNLNFEGGNNTPTDIDSVDGGLAYLIYDFYTGSAPASLLGTTAFKGEWPLTVVANCNDTLGFYVERTDGTGSSYVDIKIPAGQYTRSKMIELLNKDLAKYFPDGDVIAKEYSSSYIQITGGKTTSITGLKGNMFKWENPDTETVYNSVFYDNICYGTCLNPSASITGTAYYNSTYTKKIAITDDNHTLKFTLNGEKKEVTLTNKEYTMSELVNELNTQMTNAGIEATATRLSKYTTPTGGKYAFYDYLTIASNIGGTSSTLEFDTSDPVSANAYDTLFKTTNFDYKQNPSYYYGHMQLTGQSNLSETITIDNNADTLSISISKEPAFSLTIPTGTYNSLDDLITVLNGQIPFARQGKIEFIKSGNQLAIKGISDEVTNISIEKTGAYKLLFAGETAKSTYKSASGTEHYLQGDTAPDIANMATITMPYDIPNASTVINQNNNYLYFYLNGNYTSVNLTPGTYSRNDLINELNRQFQKNNYHVKASLTGNALTLTTTLTGISQSLSIQMNSSYGSAWKAFLGTTESEPSKPQSSYIQGVNDFTSITLDSNNNKLTLSYNNKRYTMTMTEKTYNTMDELINELQQQINTQMGLNDEGNPKVTVKKSNDCIRLESPIPFTPDETPITNFYNTVLGKYIDTVTTTNPSIVNQGSHSCSDAFIIGRQDLTTEPVEIITGFNDAFILDYTYNSSKDSSDDYMKTLEITIPAGTYTGDEIAAYLKTALNQKFADEGIDGFEINVTVGGEHNTGVVGSNDAQALQITMKEKTNVENPAGTYLIDGVRGNASYFIFYKTTGKLTSSYVKGAEDLTDGVTFAPGENTLNLYVDSIPYTYTFPENTDYTTEEFLSLLNSKFLNGDDNGAKAALEASLEDGKLKLTYRGYGSHTITGIGGSARGTVFYHEEAQDEQDAFMIHVGANSQQRMELPHTRINTTALGVNSLTISKPKYAEKSLGRISTAIARLSNKRSTFGAMQNRLEHVLSNNQNTSENVQASESLVRDTDIPLEMVDYSKSNILMQVSQSVLAQANQSPNRMLELLDRM